MTIPDFKTELGHLINGDCALILKDISDDSIDLIATDPPYALVSGEYEGDGVHSGGFMGKDWDAQLPSVEIWKECVRILKPGAFAFVMSAPRQDVLSQMIIRLGQAGFNMAFSSIYWAYGSGFPKAMNMSKAVDRKLGYEREVVGTQHRPEGRQFAEGQSGFAKGEVDITIPASPEAKKLAGSYAGFQPKPAVEVIIVAMKPLSEKTYVEQAMKNGKAVTWIDDCRIPYDKRADGTPILPSDAWYSKKTGGIQTFDGKSDNQVALYNPKKAGEQWQDNPIGRFPANLLVSDNVLDDGKISKSSGGSGEASINSKLNTDSIGCTSLVGLGGYGDIGSFSRYFDLDKWAVEKGVKDTFPFLIVPKAPKSEKNEGCEDLEPQECQPAGLVGAIAKGTERPRDKRSNFHPTVKPVKLMAYLVTLGSREGDTVVDPFLGSGTTAVACEQFNRRWIGVELSPDYCDIIKARLDTWKGQKRLF